jgi:transposase
LLYERFAIEVLLAARGVSAAADLLGLSWDQMHGIMERAVARGLSRREWAGLCHLGMDEKSFGRGQSSISLLTDLKGSRVLEVMPDNDRAAADQLLASLPEPVRAAIEAVCIDMSGHFGATVRAGLPQAAVVHDRFHISAHLNDGVAAVHREENRRLQKLGDERLKGTQRLFGFDPDKLNEEQAVQFAELKASDLKSARAWAIKEVFRRFWYYTYEGSARKFFQSWYGWAIRSRLRPMIKVAKMLKRHFENIITYLRYPISNAVTEGLNSKIQALKSNARGFRSFANYRTRILFFCGKLDLSPL